MAQTLEDRAKGLEERSATLTERLKTLEEFRNANPIGAYLEKRPEGMNPLKILSGWTGGIEARGALEREKAATEANLTDLLLKMKEAEEGNEPSWSEKAAWLDRGYVWDPEIQNFKPISGDFKTDEDYYIDAIKSGQMEWKDLTPTEKGAVIKRAGERNIDLPQLSKSMDQQTKTSVEGIINLLNDLKSFSKEITIMTPISDIIGGNVVDSRVKMFNSKKKLASQFLAKMVERNRLSNEDRNFYLQQIMNISPFGMQSRKEEFIDQLIDDLKTVTGYSAAEQAGFFGVTEGESNYGIDEDILNESIKDIRGK